MIREGLFIGCDGDVNVVGLRAARDPAIYLADATVTFALYPTDYDAIHESNAIAGTSGTCVYVADSNGCYIGALADNQTLLLSSGVTYFVGIKVVTADGKTTRDSLPYTAQIRRGR